MARLLTILIGFVLACLAAGATTVAFVVTPAEIAGLDWSTAAGRLSVAGLMALASAIQSAIFSAPMALLAVGIGEWMRQRTWTYYAVSGLVIAVLGFLAQYLSEAQGQPTIVNNYAFTAFAAAGFVAGFVYWMVAGRKAGRSHAGRLDSDGEGKSRGSVPTVSVAVVAKS